MFSSYGTAPRRRHDLRIAGGGIAMLAAAVFLGRVLLNELAPQPAMSGDSASVTQKMTNYPHEEQPAPAEPTRRAADTKKPPEQPEVIQAKQPIKESQAPPKDRSRKADAAMKDQSFVSQNVRPLTSPVSAVVITYGGGKVTSRTESSRPVGKKGEESTRPRIVKNPGN